MECFASSHESSRNAEEDVFSSQSPGTDKPNDEVPIGEYGGINSENEAGAAAQTATPDKIKVLVGALHTVFLLDRSRICSISPYFATIFASRATLQVVLPDIEPNLFQLVSDWLYTGRLSADAEDDLYLDQLVDVYLFGDLISCHTLKNYSMDLIQDNMYRHVRYGSGGIKLSLNQIRRIFSGTMCAEDAPIRKLVAALVSYRLIFGDTPERLEPIFEVPGFLKDFAAFQRSSLQVSSDKWYRPVTLRDDPRVRGYYDDGVAAKGFHACFFHVHELGEKCSSVSNYRTGSDGSGIDAAGEHEREEGFRGMPQRSASK
ncbi:uncharacterized protein L3040_008124 [Drepanopeziza brunnea f. sp. 'multigermtubi']|uniref:uncharacterized protein n=1 Tax=Drepanopeziza brunnea f. sp. 'multigermtubi' TaxID=698441 RepID=UPI002385524C|nr:hypothetical protein L3040_008124 [Drepanopeziza brunnea f. sp. 'multigermtubi']